MSVFPSSPPGQIVDAHHHFWWEPTVHDYPWMSDELAAIRSTFGPEELRPVLARCGAAHTVLVQTRSTLLETRHFLEVARTTEFIAGVVGWVDLAAPDVGTTLADLQVSSGGQYLRGIRHQVHDEPDPTWLLRPAVLDGLRAVRDAGLAYDLLIRPRELPAAVEVAQCLPDLRLVVDHIAKPPIATGALDGWGSGLAALSKFPNVSCKLSGMVTEARWSDWTVEDIHPYAERVLSWFGSERVMFGSDWPVCLLAASYDDVLATCRRLIAGLSPSEQDRVLRGNAITVYRLEGAGAVTRVG
jgi:L-fuconolactonase